MDGENELTPLYVTDPELIKDGIGSYTRYTLKGTRVPDPLTRRYRDFDSLRSKLVERWPGIFIPNIPHKKTVGAKDKEVVDLRKEMINRFCTKISEIGCLFNSDEMEYFLQNSSDVSKTLSNMPPQSYSDLLKKYSSTFTDYDENFDFETGKANQTKFLQNLKAALPKIRNFRELIKSSKERFQKTQESNTATINLLSVYEKETIKDYAGGDEGKLIFFNISNNSISEKIQKVQENIVNPYDKLYDDITGDMLDTEAMIEALVSLDGLKESYDKLTKNYNSTTGSLTELQAGKSNIKSVFSFKSREEDINGLVAEKDRLESELNALEQVIKVATYNMEKEITKFKGDSLDVYYNELSKLDTISAENNSIYNSLWDSIIGDPNIKNFLA